MHKKVNIFSWANILVQKPFSRQYLTIKHNREHCTLVVSVSDAGDKVCYWTDQTLIMSVWTDNMWSADAPVALSATSNLLIEYCIVQMYFYCFRIGNNNLLKHGHKWMYTFANDP